MRKILVKIFNIGFLACALFAALSLGIEPLARVSLNVKISEENLTSLLADANIGSSDNNETPDTEEPGEDSGEDSSTSDNIMDKLTPAKLAEGVGDLNATFNITVPANICFHPKDQEVIKRLIKTNIDDVVSTFAELMTGKLKNVIRTVAMDVAEGIISDKIAEQIEKYHPEGAEDLVDQQQVDDIVKSVYELFDSQEKTTVGELSETLMGTKTYVPADTPSGKISESTTTYYVKISESPEEYEKVVETYANEEFDQSLVYYTVEYGSGVLGVLQDLEEKGISGFENINYDEIDSSEIEGAMVDALETMPGLTNSEYVETTEELTADNFPENNDKYYELKDGEYVLATEFNEGTTYYEKVVTITNIDAALVALMNQFLGGNEDSKENEEPNKAHKITRAETAENDDDLEEQVKGMIKKFLPLDSIEGLADRTVSRVTPIALTCFMGLLLFPWVLFGLVTFIRTLRPRKCWTKLWIVFIFAFIQVILGAGIVIGFKVAYPKLIDMLTGKMGSGDKSALVNILKDSSISLKTGCYVASFVYLAMIVLGIIYVFIAHRVKVEYKMDKKLDSYDKKYGRYEYDPCSDRNRR